MSNQVSGPRILPNGTRVTINSKDSWAHEGWGVIKGFDGENYHVAMYAGDGTLIFAKRELRVKRSELQRRL